GHHAELAEPAVGPGARSLRRRRVRRSGLAPRRAGLGGHRARHRHRRPHRATAAGPRLLPLRPAAPRRGGDAGGARRRPRRRLRLAAPRADPGAPGPARRRGRAAADGRSHGRGPM
ncbi:MAG: hypothetical protein AVDCRST_MAG35-482, partial [uncultured Quadrisphaera sp.]